MSSSLSPISTHCSMYSRSRSTAARGVDTPMMDRIFHSRRSTSSCRRRYSSARSTVSTPKRFHRKASFWIWGTRSRRLPPFPCRRRRRAVYPVSSRMTSVGRAR